MIILGTAGISRSLHSTGLNRRDQNAFATQHQLTFEAVRGQEPPETAGIAGSSQSSGWKFAVAEISDPSHQPDRKRKTPEMQDLRIRLA